MKTWIALLRGINVGGRNKLLMAQLASLMHELGFIDIKTYIQSGNIVFRSSSSSATKLSGKICNAIGERFGFNPPVFVISKDRFLSIADANPFPKTEGKDLHFFFLNEQPLDFDHAALDALKAKSESWRLLDGIFYLHAPEGFHGSKLAAKVERVLGVSATCRNWQTVLKITLLANDTE